MFTEDFTAFFDTQAGFATSATIGGVSVPVIFDDGYQAMLQGFAEATTPQIMCKSGDTVGVTHDTPVLHAGVSYTVTAIEPDGTGITVLRLRK